MQQALEEAFEPLRITTRPTPASRTDRGVHARMQVVMVKAPADVTDEQMKHAADQALAPNGGAAIVRGAATDFQPQWSATGKEYRYRLWPSRSEPPPYCWQVPGMDVGQFRRALEEVEGSHDFSALHGATSAKRTRTIERAEVVERDDGVIEARLVGDAFGRFGVRLLVGTAAEVAMDRITQAQFRGAIREQRSIPGVRAPAEGLVLWAVHYPAESDPFTEEERNAALDVQFPLASGRP